MTTATTCRRSKQQRHLSILIAVEIGPSPTPTVWDTCTVTILSSRCFNVLDSLRAATSYGPDCTVLRYETSRGQMYQGTVESILNSNIGRRLRGKVQLIFTSPPYPLNRKKRYGNLTGDSYVRWLSELAPHLSALLKPDGSLVMNWEIRGRLVVRQCPRSRWRASWPSKKRVTFTSANNSYVTILRDCHRQFNG